MATNQFRDWISQSRKTLFCPGVSGAGKTIIAAIVVDDLQRNFETSPTVAIAYVYCDYRRQFQQKPVHLLASLLKQLNQKSSSIPQQGEKLLYEYSGTSSAIKIITQRLLSVIRKLSRVFVVVDGLDQCQNSCGEWKELLTIFFYLQDNARANLLLTSRFIPEIEMLLNGRSTQLEIRAKNQDLQTYFDSTKSSSLISQSEDSWRTLKSTLMTESDGM